MYSLRILFFSLPLYFSHVLSPVGVIIWESYSFERYKVYLFLILLIVAYIEVLIRFPERILDTLCRYFSMVATVLLLPVVSALYFTTPLDNDWLFGSYEKHHWYILYFGVISLILLLMVTSREYTRSYLRWSIYAAVIVALVAIWEYIGGIWDIYSRHESLSAYPGRSVSTLGNPNYVAWYLLIFLPLCTRLRLSERWIILWLLIIAILTTGSYIGIALLGGYFLYSLVRYLGVSAVYSFLVVCIWTIGSIYIGSFSLDPDKMLSLMSRFILMRESLSIMLREPISLLIWFGPDSLLTYFSTARSSAIDAYFPPTSLIDSSHNIFIDILFQYGVLPLFLIGWSVYRYWNNQPEELYIAAILGLLFLALNVFVITHIIVLSLLIVLTCKSVKH